MQIFYEWITRRASRLDMKWARGEAVIQLWVYKKLPGQWTPVPPSNVTTIGYPFLFPPSALPTFPTWPKLPQSHFWSLHHSHTHTHTHTCTHRCTSPASTGLEGGCPGHLLDPGLSCSKIKICPFWCQRSAWLAFQHGSDTRGEEQGTCIDHLQPGGVNLTSHNPHKTLKSEHHSCLTPKEKPRMKRGRDKDKAAETHTRRSFRVCPGLSLTEADTAESRQTDTQGSLASSGKVEGALWFRSRCVDEFQ